MKILGYDVVFYRNHVTVGCQYVSNELVKKVAGMTYDADKMKSAGRPVDRLKLEHDGKWFTAVIDGKRACGVVRAEKKHIYLCQDTATGTDCKDKRGFANSWTVETGTNLKYFAVRDVRIFRSCPFPGAPEKNKLPGREIYVNPGRVTYRGRILKNAVVRRLAAEITKNANLK